MSEIILTIITLLLTGTNIFQFIFIRQERKKAEALAEDAEVEVDRKKYELSKDKYASILGEVERVQQRCLDLQKQVRDQAEVFTDELLKIRQKASDLMGQVTYYKQFRCFRSDCSKRMWDKSDASSDCPYNPNIHINEENT